MFPPNKLASLYLSSDDVKSAGLLPILSQRVDTVQADDGRLSCSVLRWAFERKRLERPDVLVWRRGSIDTHAARELMRIHHLGIGVVVMARTKELRGHARALFAGSWRHGNIALVVPNDAAALLQVLDELARFGYARSQGRPSLPRAEIPPTLPPLAS